MKYKLKNYIKFCLFILICFGFFVAIEKTIEFNYWHNEFQNIYIGVIFGSSITFLIKN